MAEIDTPEFGKVIFELVSPERIVISETVEMVVIPGTEGDFGVLPGHAPLISSIRPGTIKIYRDDIVTETIFIASGFAEVTAERCTVLADNAVCASDLDRAKVAEELALATVSYEAGKSSDDIDTVLALDLALRIAAAKQEAIDAR